MRTFALVTDIRDQAVHQGGIDVVDVVPFRSRSFRFRERLMPLFQRALTTAIGRFEPDIIHQHFGTWSLPAVSAGRRGKIPLAVTLHGADVFAALRSASEVPVGGRPMLRWHQRNTAQAFQAAGMILAVSEFLAGEAVRAGADPDRVAVHYQGIDTDYFSPGPPLSLPRSDREPEVVFVGGLSVRKGIPDLLEASISAARSHPHRLRIVGEGPLKTMVEQAAHEHGHIDLVGGLPKEGIRDVLRTAAALVLPTQRTGGWREAAGLVLLEAQACGVPVVAYNSGGTPEMLIDGKTGRLVEEFNRNELADTMKDILSATPDSRAQMARQAREFVVNERSVAVSAQRLEEKYYALVS